MRKLTLVIAILFLASVSSFGQEVSEPEFIGEAYLLKTDGSTVQLDKEIGDFTSGMSWSNNSWNALNLEVAGGKAQQRMASVVDLKLVVRAVDNNSDPLTIVSIYKLKAKKKSRVVLISKDNSGTLMKSKTNSKELIRFSAKKYGKSSYLITLPHMPAGEYGIVVSNPNSRDEKRVIVSCFGID